MRYYRGSEIVPDYRWDFDFEEGQTLWRQLFIQNKKMWQES